MQPGQTTSCTFGVTVDYTSIWTEQPWYTERVTQNGIGSAPFQYTGKWERNLLRFCKDVNGYARNDYF